MILLLTEKVLNSYEEFLELREISDEKLELIDSIVYMAPAPSPRHQEICFLIGRSFYDFFKNSNCKMLQGVNIRLFDDNKNRIGDVIPDISIFCNYKNLNNAFIEETPLIVVEIVSPSTVYIDNIKKADLYKRAGITEYWIVNLARSFVTLWNFSSNEQIIYTDSEILKSSIYSDFSLDLHQLFNM